VKRVVSVWKEGIKEGLETLVMRVSNPYLWFRMGKWFLFVSLTLLNTFIIFEDVFVGYGSFFIIVKQFTL
jgi:hypothetical protein